MSGSITAFFFTSSLPHLPPPSYPPSYLPSPTYHLPPPSYPKPTSPSYLPPMNPTPPHSIARARLVERKLELWSYCCGAVELEQELERPPDPRPHDQVKCLFFILFLFVLFEEASKLQAPEFLRSFSASELACCN
jgi:hypothetical protein